MFFIILKVILLALVIWQFWRIHKICEEETNTGLFTLEQLKKVDRDILIIIAILFALIGISIFH